METYYASDWTGRLCEAEAQHWFCLGLEAHERELTPYEREKTNMANDWMFGQDYRHSFKAKLEAIKAIITDKDAELEYWVGWVEESEGLPRWAYMVFNKALQLAIRFVCLVSLLLYRSGSINNDHHTFAWGYSPSYAGWDAWFIEFDAKTFRYNIYTDGEWNM